MSRVRRFVAGAAIGYLGSAITALIGLWLTRFYLRSLGQGTYGLWLLGAQVIAYASLLDLGIVSLLPREVAATVGRSGGSTTDDLSRQTGEVTRIVLWQVPILAAVLALVWMALPSSWQPLRGPLATVFVGFTLLFPLRIPQAVLSGLQELAYLGWVQLGSWAVNALLTVVLVLGDWQLHSFAFAFLASQLVSAALCLHRLRSRHRSAFPSRLPHLSWTSARRLAASGAWVTVNQIAQVLLAGTDVLISGALFGPIVTVTYACTAKLASLLGGYPSAFMQYAGPGLSELRATASRERLATVTGALSQAMLLLSGGVALVVLAVNGGFVTWWVGPERYGGLALTVAFVAQMMLRHWNVSVGYALYSFGYERHLAIVAIVDGLVTTACSIGLARHMGLVGIPLGSVIGVALVSLPANLSRLAAEMRAPRRSTMFLHAPFAARLAPAAAVAIAIDRYRVPDTVPALAAAAVLVTACYIALMLPHALRAPLGPYLRPRLEAALARWRLGREKPAQGADR